MTVVLGEIDVARVKPNHSARATPSAQAWFAPQRPWASPTSGGRIKVRLLPSKRPTGPDYKGHRVMRDDAWRGQKMDRSEQKHRSLSGEVLSEQGSPSSNNFPSLPTRPLRASQHSWPVSSGCHNTRTYPPPTPPPRHTNTPRPSTGAVTGSIDAPSSQCD